MSTTVHEYELLNHYERIIVAHVRRRNDSGSFMNSLCKALFAADPENRNLIRLGFPELVAAYDSWYSSELRERLEAHGFTL